MLSSVLGAIVHAPSKPEPLGLHMHECEGLRAPRRLARRVRKVSFSSRAFSWGAGGGGVPCQTEAVGAEDCDGLVHSEVEVVLEVCDRWEVACSRVCEVRLLLEV